MRTQNSDKQRPTRELGIRMTSVRVDPNNVAKIVNFPRPKNKTDIRAFVSLAGFYRRHVQNFSELVASLNRLLGKKVD